MNNITVPVYNVLNRTENKRLRFVLFNNFITFNDKIDKNDLLLYFTYLR